MLNQPERMILCLQEPTALTASIVYFPPCFAGTRSVTDNMLFWQSVVSSTSLSLICLSGLTCCLSWYQVMWGIGRPTALHTRSTFSPSLKFMSLGVSMNSGGWTTKKIKHPLNPSYKMVILQLHPFHWLLERISPEGFAQDTIISY